jgi:predicted phage terminase large subunit-like protein
MANIQMNNDIDIFISCELARHNFWEYCKATSPDFYNEETEHLKELCNTLDSFLKGKPLEGKVYKKLMLNYPPQHGKTRTLIKFTQWALGRNKSERIINCSYSDDTATDFSRYTRDGIKEEKNISSYVVFSDIFPNVKIKHGDSAVKKWALEGEHFNYLGAGTGGGITSKGATILMIDDPIKGIEEALNEAHLEKIWLWYVGTFLSRVSAEGGEPLEIINHTRWSKNDLCGRILVEDFNNEWYVLKRKANNNGMLCDKMLSEKRYLDLKKLAYKNIKTKMVFKANYDQETIDLEGCLYSSFKTYKDVPKNNDGVYNYTDTADEGTDFLCSINYVVYNLQAYVINVYYTDEKMEITEPKTAEIFFNDKVNTAKIESNNGGKGFARAVDKYLKEVLKSSKTVIKWFHQSGNKQSRINTNANWVQENIYFPENWMDKWASFYDHVTNYQAQGKNKTDDPEDCLTGIAEHLSKPQYKIPVSR